MFNWGRKSAPAQPKPATSGVVLADLLAAVLPEVAPLEGAEVQLALVRAQLADRFRDIGLTPVRPETFDGLVRNPSMETIRRLALAIRFLEAIPDELLSSRFQPKEDLEPVVKNLLQVAQEAELLTLNLMGQSDIRFEEYARRVLAALLLPLEGETEEASQAALWRLDYGRLLKEAGLAKASAEQRAEYLRQLQENAARTVRRGKF